MGGEGAEVSESVLGEEAAGVGRQQVFHELVMGVEVIRVDGQRPRTTLRPAQLRRLAGVSSGGRPRQWLLL